jgi:ABC-type nitrate/sulfonate/bicarbonate transport system permease component
MPFLSTFFPMIENTAQGVRGIDQRMKDLTRLFQATRWVRFRHVTAPHILPYVMAGLKIGTLQAISGVIVAEFVAPEQGLGFMLILGQQFARTELTFAAIFLVAVLGVGFYKTVELTERRVVFWETKAGGRL